MAEIAFEFLGGPLDGTTTATAKSNKRVQDEVNGWLWLTNNGEVGKRFWTALLSYDELTGAIARMGKLPHYYEISDRIDVGDDATIRAKYLGTENPSA